MSDTVRIYVDGKPWTTMSRELYDEYSEASRLVQGALMHDLRHVAVQTFDSAS